MSVALRPQELSTVALAYRSQQELQRFQHGAESDPQYAFELFRRALTDPDQPASRPAWEAIYRQYFATVVRWAQQHPLFPHTGESGDYFATQALTNLWLYFAEGRGDVQCFADLRRLLSFLQVCVNHVIIDYYRAYLRRTALADEDEPPATGAPAALDLDPVEREELWQAIYQEAHTELERLWIYGYCELLLPRRQIVEIFPEFGSIDEVKRVMDTFLKRVRRNERLKTWLAAYYYR
ncbi:MAG: hypothetical protein ACOYNY_41235 [Caldilineaceae bacterium]|jgi:hypothetical protein